MAIVTNAGGDAVDAAASAREVIAGRVSVSERPVRRRTALDKSSWEIGRILSISENTVVFHIKNAMKKLGASNRTLAALKAVQFGLIKPVVEAESKMPRRNVQPSDLIGDGSSEYGDDARR